MYFTFVNLFFFFLLSREYISSSTNFKHWVKKKEFSVFLPPIRRTLQSKQMQHHRNGYFYFEFSVVTPVEAAFIYASLSNSQHNCCVPFYIWFLHLMSNSPHNDCVLFYFWFLHFMSNSQRNDCVLYYFWF
jgi:hypothetical protein